MFKTLQAFKDWKSYWSHEANEKVWYFKACTRCSDLAKRGYLKVVEIKTPILPNRQSEFKYRITEKWMLEVGVCGSSMRDKIKNLFTS